MDTIEKLIYFKYVVSKFCQIKSSLSPKIYDDIMVEKQLKRCLSQKADMIQRP